MLCAKSRLGTLWHSVFDTHSTKFYELKIQDKANNLEFRPISVKNSHLLVCTCRHPLLRVNGHDSLQNQRPQTRI